MVSDRRPSQRRHAGSHPAPTPSRSVARLAQAALLALGLGAGQPASAALGAVFAGAQTAPARAVIVRRLQQRPGCSVHETLLPSGTTVREYVGPDRHVFAVTWQGPQRPDLRALLGDYFVPFDAAAAQAHAAHRPVALHRADLVARSGGHMRAFHGSAYVPALLPSGVTARDID